MSRSKTHNIKLVAGVEGPSVYINDYRVVGPKPWGGGDIVGEWWASEEDIKHALSRAGDTETVAARKKRLAAKRQRREIK